MKNLSDEELLNTRIKDLPISLEDSEIYELVRGVLNDLKAKNLNFVPRIYLGDEWFSPEGIAAVSIPFFLANQRLRSLEQKIIKEVEGDDPQEFARLLRHEIGHAFDHAFKISKRRSWQKVFGSPSQEYHPETYRPRPYSRNFVIHLPRWYAQAHPDEDFAETFAVWLDPHSNWQQTYKNWGALKKLQYIDKVAREFAEKEAPFPRGRMMSDFRHLSSTLRYYYERKKKNFQEDYPDFFDEDLISIFGRAENSPEKPSQILNAARLMQTHSKSLIQTIAKWTGERKFTIESLLKRLTHRCRELDLKVYRDSQDALLDLSSYVSSLVANYLFTGHFKRRM